MRKYLLFWGEFSHDGEMFNYCVISGNSPEHAVERFKKKREREHKYVPPDDTTFYVVEHKYAVEVRLKQDPITYTTETSAVTIR